MSTNTGAVIVEIDLKKKKLTQQILQLERQLQKQEKKVAKQDFSNKKQRSKMTVSPRDDKTLSKSTFKQMKEVKPAISDNWKQLFKLQPQLRQPQSTKYFDKSDFKTQGKYQGPNNDIYNILKNRVEVQWQFIV